MLEKKQFIHGLKIFALAAIYFATAQWALSLNAVNGFATLVWPPTGISLAALLIFGSKLWPAVTLGAFLVSFLVGPSLPVALGVSLGCTLEVVFACMILNRLGFQKNLERLSDVIYFVLIAVLGSTLIGATVGVSSLYLGSVISSNAFWATWITWCLGDTMSNLIVVPLILVWSKGVKISKSPWRLLEITAIAISFIIASLLIFSDWMAPGKASFFRPYLAFPVAMLVALRLGQRGLVIANFGMAALILWVTSRGEGRFVSDELSQNFIIAQVFMAVLITSKLILAGIVSERKNKQGALKESNAQRAAVLNVALDCIITMDHDGNVIEFNAAAEKLFGYTRDAILGKALSELIVPARYREAYRKGLARYLSSGNSQVLGKRLELPAMKSDGTEITVEIAILPLDTGGAPMFTAFLKDVTERKQLEKDRKRALESEKFLSEATELLSASIDYKTTLLHIAQTVVPEFADLCIVHVLAEDNSFQSIEVVCSVPEKQAVASQLVKKYLSDLKSPTLLSSVFKHKKTRLMEHFSLTDLTAISNDEVHLQLLRSLDIKSLIVCPILFHGRPLGAISIAVLNSERRYGRYEVTLFEELARRSSIAIENARLYHEAQEAIFARDEFLSIASHELKTPLTTLSLHLQMFARSLKKSISEQRDAEQSNNVLIPLKIAKNVSECEVQCYKLTNLLDELLDLTRIRLGKLHLEREAFDLSLTMKEVVSRFRHDAAQKSAQFELIVEPAVVVHWDRMRIEQVLSNLFSNAIKYGNGKNVLVTLSKDELSRKATIAVKDSGLGISPEMREKIFERFERAGVTGKKISGLGLGLYICRQIVEAHGGKIHVESEEGQGSKFVVELGLD